MLSYVKMSVRPDIARVLAPTFVAGAGRMRVGAPREAKGQKSEALSLRLNNWSFAFACHCYTKKWQFQGGHCARGGYSTMLYLDPLFPR
jgi:hypothetical protein